jgi:hypothetical protein
MSEGYPRSTPSGNGYASERTPSWRMLSGVIAGPGGCFCLVIVLLGLPAAILTQGAV